VFFHDRRLQYNAKPVRPDPVYAKKLQELLGGQWGEITVALQYLFQGWNTRIPGKYRDMLLDTGTEELAHIEMLATMIARLLEGAPVAQEEAARHPVIAAVLGDMNPQHAIVSGLGPQVADSVGYPWNGRYVTASGNLLADFRYNLTAESQGRLQAVRLYNMTDDPGVRDMLAFLIARDTMHQNQWLAAMAELEAEGLERTPVPSAFPPQLEHRQFSYQFWNLSAGTESAQGRWAQGPSPDGRGQFQYVANPVPLAPPPEPPPVPNPRVFDTLSGHGQAPTGPTRPGPPMPGRPPGL